MKILVVTSVFPNLKQPGLGVFVKERMFNVSRHSEIKVVAPVPWFPFIGLIKKGYRPRVDHLEIQDGIEVYHPRFFNFPGFLKSLDGFFFFLSIAYTVWKLRRRFDFDVIDAHFAYPDGLGAVLLGRLFKRPVTVTVRGTIGKLSRYPLRRMQIRYALKKAARVFSVCEDLKETATGLGIPGSKITVIENGVDIEKFRPVDKLEARRVLGLPPDKKIVISIGGLVERKGFHRVLSVLPEIKKAVPDVMYLIVGGASVEGDYEHALRKMVRGLNLEEDVVFAGPRPHDELYRWLSASDLFCLATSNEGWANVFLEAFACGLPVVTTRVGGNFEVVSSDNYGLLFDLGDENGMKEAVIKALKKEWDTKMIINYARENAWDGKVKKLCREFEETVNFYRRSAPDKAVTG